VGTPLALKLPRAWLAPAGVVVVEVLRTCQAQDNHAPFNTFAYTVSWRSKATLVAFVLETY